MSSPEECVRQVPSAAEDVSDVPASCALTSRVTCRQGGTAGRPVCQPAASDAVSRCTRAGLGMEAYGGRGAADWQAGRQAGRPAGSRPCLAHRRGEGERVTSWRAHIPVREGGGCELRFTGGS